MAQPPNEVNALLAQAEAASESKDYPQAENLYRNIISLRTTQSSADKSESMREMYNLSVVLLKQGKKLEAQAYLIELLPLLEARRVPDDETTRDFFRQQEEGARRLLASAKGVEIL